MIDTIAVLVGQPEFVALNGNSKIVKKKAFFVMKQKKLLMWIVLSLLLFANVSFGKDQFTFGNGNYVAGNFYPENVAVNPEWIKFDSYGRAAEYQVLKNPVNIVAKVYTGEHGLVVVTRDLIRSHRGWEETYDGKYAQRDALMWGKDYQDMTPTELGTMVTYYVVYKDKYNKRYRSFCFKSVLFSTRGKVVAIKRDNIGDYPMPYLEETPKLERAINKYLEVNGYASLDELFKAKRIE